MNIERLEKNAKEGDPEAQYLLFREKERRGELSLPSTPVTHSRKCFRCGAELTDEQSLSRGMGKTCWGHVDSKNEKMEPDIEKVKKLHAKFLSKMDFRYWEASVVIARLGNFLYTEKLNQKILKEICRKILWALSFGLPSKQNEILLSLLEALGYSLLVKILKNQAVIGRAKVSTHDGILYLKAPRPKRVVVLALKGAGALFDWPSHTWNFPGAKASKAADVIKRYFLNVEGLEEALETLKETLKEFPEAGLKRFISETGVEEVEVKTPYNSDFISELKAQIPYGIKGPDNQWFLFREFDRSDKVWVIRKEEHIKTIKELVTKYFLSESLPRG